MSTPNIILIKRRLADSPLGTSTISLSVGEFAYNEVNHTLYIGTSSLGTLDVAGPGSYTRLSLTNTLTSGLQNQINTLSIGTSTELQSISSVLNTKIDTVSSTLTTDVNALSSNLNNLRIYTDSSFLPLSGGTVTGKVYIHDNLTIYGNVSATGNSYFSNTIYSTTSALSVVNLGNNGPALYVANDGTGDLASFYDIDSNLEVFHIGGANGDFPNIGIKTSTPNKDLTVFGDISASGSIFSTNSIVNNSLTANNISLNNNKIFTDSDGNLILTTTLSGNGLNRISNFIIDGGQI
jgi:hypothetical protein